MAGPDQPARPRERSPSAGLLRSLGVALRSPNSNDPAILRLQFRWAVIAAAFATFCGALAADEFLRPLPLIGAVASVATIGIALAWSPGTRPWWDDDDE